VVKRLELSKGHFALVDDDVYEWASQYKWALSGGDSPERRYAARYVCQDGRPRLLYLHREILGVPPGLEVDHRNHDRLDNRRENLRPATRSQNEQNRAGANTQSSTGIRGVEVRRPTKSGPRYRAVVWVDGRRCHLGTFDTPEAAGEAAARARRVVFTHSAEREVC
jgi:hypothetical protein